MPEQPLSQGQEHDRRIRDIKRIVKWLVFFAVVGWSGYALYSRYYPLMHLHSINKLHRAKHPADAEHNHSVIGEKEKPEEEHPNAVEEHLNAVEALHESLHLAGTKHDTIP